MQELKMQHRVALATVVSIVIMVVYSYVFPPPEPPPEELDASAEGASVEGSSEQPDSVEKIAAGEREGNEGGPSPVEPAAGPAGPAGPAAEIVSHRLHNDLLALDVDNGPGGLITGSELLGDQFRNRETQVGLDFLMLPEGAKTLEFGFMPNETDFGWTRVAGELRAKDDRHIEVARRQGDIELVETLTLLEGYELEYEVVVRNHGLGAQQHRIELGAGMGLPAETSRYDIHRALCRTPEDLEDFDHGDVEDESESLKGGLDWLALDSKYFVQAVVPAERMSGCVVSSDEAATAIINTAVGREVSLGPGEQKRYVFGLFLGAKVDTMLDVYPVSAELSEISSADLGEVIDWGWFGRLSKFLGSMMLALLRWFYGLTGVWGVAIIMLTVVIKATLLPLTIKQYRSMRKMKELQPEMEKVKEKYGDDKAKQQQEMQALFQRTGVNPLAGCTPMILQFPVWIALYAMLGAVMDLYNEPFLWLPDLTQPDPFYILPIGMGGLMFIQTRMNPTAGDAQQAKMMQWMMPVMFMAMMLFLPSGLGVYIFANIVLSLVQSFIQLRTKDDGAAEPAK